MLEKRGQASLEVLFILVIVLAVVSVLQLRGDDMTESYSVIHSARKGVQNSITKLSLQNGIEIDLSDLRRKGDNVSVSLIVQGDPPPTDKEITENVESFAEDRLDRSVGGSYEVNVEIEKRVKK